MTKLKNIHPGEILLEEFLTPMDIAAPRGGIPQWESPSGGTGLRP